jgi:hypothetical protein
MLSLLLNQIDAYLTGVIPLTQLEDWVISHLQEILNSGDQKAIEIANKMDADIVQFGEGIFDKLTLHDRLQNYFLNAQTNYCGEPLPMPDIVTSTNSSTIRVFKSLMPVEEVRVQFEFV